MKRLAILIIAAAVPCLSSQASAQSIAPTTAIVTTYGYGRPSTADESWARGRADLMRAAGERDLNSSLAARNWEAARTANIDNWAYQIRTRNEIRDERQARDRAEHPPLSPAQQQYLTRIRDPKRLSASQLTAAGVIRWPSALRSPEFDATRSKLDTLFAERAQASTAYADEITRKVDAAAIEMTKNLEQSGAAIPIMDRVNAKNFVASLRFEAHLRSVAGEVQVAAATK
jgi:hypothetical protein